ncbi:unnamed protein product [Phaedon cochleariae]|uniref:PHD-type domain-containing protein n=1 Tax=Phaedon cochleariae TaxID=80249 RepID=A0A9N9SAS3_PHACE|nr:unnamed protein product [Phaedon cochleariae]
MQSICNTCVQTITKKSPGIQCSGFCKYSYHQKCVGLTIDKFKLLKAIPGSNWKCPTCSAVPATSPQHVDTPSVSSTVDVFDDNDHNSGGRGEMSVANVIIQIRNELRAFRLKQDELVDSVSFCSNKITDFEKTLGDVKGLVEKFDAMKEENEDLKKQVISLDSRMNMLEQYSRMNNVEIQGATERKDENLISVV